MKKKKLKKRIKKLEYTVEWLKTCNRRLALKIDKITKKEDETNGN